MTSARHAQLSHDAAFLQHIERQQFSEAYALVGNDLEAYYATFARLFPASDPQSMNFGRSSFGNYALIEVELSQLANAAGYPLSVLDLGCGNGAILDTFQRAEEWMESYTGLDACQLYIDSGRARHPDATFIHGQYLDDDLPLAETYDAVIGCAGLSIVPPRQSPGDFLQSILERYVPRALNAVIFNGLKADLSHITQYDLYTYWNRPLLEVIGSRFGRQEVHRYADHLYHLAVYPSTSAMFA